ncbi:MAG TPA: N-acetylmuramoyl-L-alanine amidase [Alcaligenes sp.]|nr:N-acetylmuramoyl-L-alanine amidase [Alcaligenes sp.]HRL28346.1 N-acetylmuramoyl-L-alanine amidase [Alcaligenes sp.]
MRRITQAAVLAAAALLAACGSGGPLKINDSLRAEGQNSRVRYLIVHYTAGDTPTSLKVLTQRNVSAHYLITDEHRPTVYRLVDENRRAWHAGLGSWYGFTDLNTGSIGIEIVNPGRLDDGRWAPYTPEQIQTLIVLLKDLAQRHGVTPRNIIGHSDVAPQRKLDPGPLFPWQELARAGLGRWYNEARARQLQVQYATQPLPQATEVQALLRKAGYETPESGIWDKATQNVIAAFQMHYRPARFDGVLDAETLAILKSLN